MIRINGEILNPMFRHKNRTFKMLPHSEPLSMFTEKLQREDYSHVVLKLPPNIYLMKSQYILLDQCILLQKHTSLWLRKLSEIVKEPQSPKASLISSAILTASDIRADDFSSPQKTYFLMVTYEEEKNKSLRIVKQFCLLSIHTELSKCIMCNYYTVALGQFNSALLARQASPPCLCVKLSQQSNCCSLDLTLQS